MKKLLPLLLVLGCALSAAPYRQTSPGDTVNGKAMLVQADARLVQDNLVITLQAAGPGITEWLHLFADTGDTPGFYEHASRRPAGQGLKMLFEGAVVYRFTGNATNHWSWAPIPGATVKRETTGDTLTLTMPYAPLGFSPGHPVHFFAATYAPDYADTLDTLPRANANWSFTPPLKP
ncbi:MAG: hypothetical protein ABII82_03020 [Verrucomicrobiota bacterium]